jgi:sirohydrochlorin cobaltochelatase
LKEGIALFAHGSRDPECSRPFERIAASLAEKLPAVCVGLAFLEYGPSLDEVLAALVAKGAGSIRVVPLFLGRPGDGKEDLPRLVKSAAAALGGARVTLEEPIGEQPKVVDAIAAAIAEGR